MSRFGGGFVKSLAATCHHADAANLERIKAAFPEIWEFYGAAGGRPEAQEEPCEHVEHDHGICLECGADITDRLVAAAENRRDALEDR